MLISFFFWTVWRTVVTKDIGHSLKIIFKAKPTHVTESEMRRPLVIHCFIWFQDHIHLNKGWDGKADILKCYVIPFTGSKLKSTTLWINICCLSELLHRQDRRSDWVSEPRGNYILKACACVCVLCACATIPVRYKAVMCLWSTPHHQILQESLSLLFLQN